MCLLARKCRPVYRLLLMIKKAGIELVVGAFSFEFERFWCLAQARCTGASLTTL